MSLKAILESHPIKNLNAVIRSVKSDIAPKLALSKDRKRHSKATLIEHILALDKMGLLKERPTMYEKPARTKKVKVEPKAVPTAVPTAVPKAVPKKAPKADEKKEQPEPKKVEKMGKITEEGLKKQLNMVPKEERSAKRKKILENFELIKKAKKPRSEKQKANDKKLGEAAKARAAAKKNK